MLGRLNKDYLYEAQWAAFGLFGGASTQSYQALRNAFFNEGATIPISSIDFIAVMICIVSFFSFWVIRYAAGENLNKATNLIKEIQSRTKRQRSGEGIETDNSPG